MARGIELTWPGKDDGESPAAGSFAELELCERHGEPSDEPNLLLHGDNLVVMQALAERFAGAIDLVYIDPPFATGLSYYSQKSAGDFSLERRAYRDDRQRGMAGYVDDMHRRLCWIHGLLGQDGKLFLHCDWRANSLLRLLCDEIFGPECFRNEIVWRRAPNLGRQAASNQLGRVIDTILVYSKTAGSRFAGEVPRRSAEVALDKKGKPVGARWDEERRLYFTTAPRGDYTDASIEKLRAEGRVYDSPTGKVYIKYFLRQDEQGRWVKDQPVDTLWDDFETRPLRHRPKSEDMGYDTQKPEGLLERIVGWASKPGDRVADFYCGSGTTVAVAEAMGRRWLACDVGQTAIAITRRRLLGAGARPFEVRSSLALERRLWAQEHDEVAAVLAAYGAEPLSGRWGVAGERTVYVAPAGARPGSAEVADWSRQAPRRGGVDVLAWEWAAGVTGPADRDVELRTIPSELLRGAPAGGVHFPGRPAVEVAAQRDGEGVRLVLEGVSCPHPPAGRAGHKPTERDWTELVEGWLVGWAEDGAAPRTRWSSHRARGGEVLLQTPRWVIPSGVRVGVKVLTVYGDEVVCRLEV